MYFIPDNTSDLYITYPVTKLFDFKKNNLELKDFLLLESNKKEGSIYKKSNTPKKENNKGK
jgi:hypothetical protein